MEKKRTIAKLNVECRVFKARVREVVLNREASTENVSA